MRERKKALRAGRGAKGDGAQEGIMTDWVSWGDGSGKMGDNYRVFDESKMIIKTMKNPNFPKIKKRAGSCSTFGLGTFKARIPKALTKNRRKKFTKFILLLKKQKTIKRDHYGSVSNRNKCNSKLNKKKFKKIVKRKLLIPGLKKKIHSL